MKENVSIAQFHLPGLFEYYEFYKMFLPIFYEHRDYFYDWVDIASIYGAPEGCIWSGGRFGSGEVSAGNVLNLLKQYGISGRLTFSNSLLTEEHLADEKCNSLCELFAHFDGLDNGVIVHSDILLDYLRNNYPDLYLVSSTTKVITDFEAFHNELKREEFKYVVPDFRLNKQFELLANLSEIEKSKVEFLCNECCYIGCKDRKACYENVSHKMLEENYPDHICRAPESKEGYKFSIAMKNPAFISREDIKNIYLLKGFCNFKIEGRNLGSAIILEFILYYLTKPEYQIHVRELVYLDSMLDLF